MCIWTIVNVSWIFVFSSPSFIEPFASVINTWLLLCSVHIVSLPFLTRCFLVDLLFICICLVSVPVMLVSLSLRPRRFSLDPLADMVLLSVSGLGREYQINLVTEKWGAHRILVELMIGRLTGSFDRVRMAFKSHFGCFLSNQVSLFVSRWLCEISACYFVKNPCCFISLQLMHDKWGATVLAKSICFKWCFYIAIQQMATTHFVALHSSVMKWMPALFLV